MLEIESSGQLTKLSRLELASTFASTHYKWDKSNLELSRSPKEAINIFASWKKKHTGKHKRALPTADYYQWRSQGP